MGILATTIQHELDSKGIKNSCKTCQILNSLDDEDRDTIAEVIKEKKLSFDKVSSILTKANYPISPTSIKRHYDRGCSPTA